MAIHNACRCTFQAIASFGVGIKIDGNLATIAFGFKDEIKQLTKNYKGLKKIEL